MKILLAGSNGFIGRRLHHMLCKEGYTVLTHSRGDSLKWGSICHADLVINAAGELRDEDKMVDDNLVFATQLANACHVFDKRLIHIGSIAERTKFDRYAVTKKAASDVVLHFAQYNFAKFSIVLPATVFGPGDGRDSFMSKIWDAHELDILLKLSEEGRDWIYIDDLCRAIIEIAKQPPFNVSGYIFEVGYGKSIQNSQIVDIFKRMVGSHIPHQIIKQTYNSWYADTVTIKALGWEPQIPLEQGVAAFIEYKMFEGKAWLGAEAG